MLSDRSVPVGGPAYLTFKGSTIQMAADWKLSEVVETGEISSNLQGLLDLRDETTMVRITCTPLGIWGTPSLANLFPYKPSSVGTVELGGLIFPGTDLPLVIQTKAGKSITFSAAAITKSPKLMLTSNPKKTLFGEMEFTCLIKNNSLQSATDAFVVVATSAYTEPNLDPATILSPRYIVTYGDTPAAPFDNIETEDGVEFSVDYAFENVVIDSIGIINMRLKSVTATVEFTPVNLTEQNYLDTILIDGTGSGRGKPRGAGGGQFTCIGVGTGDPSLTIAKAQPIPGGMRFGSNGRIDKMKLQAVRKAVVSVLQPLFTLGTAA